MLLMIDAPIQQRYERVVSGRGRAREEELSFEGFVSQEELEMAGGPNQQQLGRVFRMANLKIDNDGTIEELEGKLDKVVLRLPLGLELGVERRSGSINKLIKR